MSDNIKTLVGARRRGGKVIEQDLLFWEEQHGKVDNRIEILCRIIAREGVGQVDQVLKESGGFLDEQGEYQLYMDLRHRVLDQISRALEGDLDWRLVLWASATLNSGKLP